jgi:hypothetical protein
LSIGNFTDRDIQVHFCACRKFLKQNMPTPPRVGHLTILSLLIKQFFLTKPSSNTWISSIIFAGAGKKQPT